MGKEELLEIFGGELPENIEELYDEVLAVYHKKANGQLDLQIGCLIAVLADKVGQHTKPAKKIEKATA